jgi:hypothetical protein
MNTSALIPVFTTWMLQLPELGDKPTIETLRLANLKKVVAIMTRSVTSNVNLLDTKDIGIELSQCRQDFVRLVVAFDVPLEATN